MAALVRKTLVGFILFCPLLACSVLLRADSAALVTPNKDEILRAVRQLGDDKFVTREKASDFLWKAGKAAEPYLQQALKSEDVEVVRRARDLLEKFKYGIYPDTPENVLVLIRKYRSGDSSAKDAAIRELLKLGKPGYPVLNKLAATEEDTNLRRSLFDRIATESAEAAGVKMAEGNFADAEELLEIGVATGHGPGLRNYAAYLLLRGRLGEKIPEYQGRLNQTGDKHTAEVLAYLHRAAGDLSSARQAAEKSGKAALLEGILFELGDWQALAQWPAKRQAESNAEETRWGPGLKATYQRLAGNQAGFEAELKKAHNDNDSWIALLFNDRPAEAMATLVKGKQYTKAVEFLALQLKFREAIELADKAHETAGDDLFALDLLKARTLHQLGEHDRAAQVLAKRAEGLDKGTSQRLASLVEVEYQLGLKDLAFEHCARMLTSTKGERSPPNLTWALRYVFPRDQAAADVWWKFFRSKYADEEASATLKRLRTLLDEKKPGQDFTGLLQELEQAAQESPPDHRETWLHALADTCGALGQDERVLGYLEKAARATGSTAAWTHLGDHLAEKKRWPQAAESYARAWDKDRKQAAPLYLQGWALAQAGQGAEGKQLMERAHWLPLGGEAQRYALAEAMAKHGLNDAVRREQELILRTGEFQSVYVTNAQNKVGEDAAVRKDYARAAACSERVLLTVLQTNVSFIRNRAYLSVPYSVHHHRARALLAAGKVDEARKEAELALNLIPGDIDLAIHLAADFERQGHKKDADDLFDRVFAVHTKLCTDFPRSGWCHNNLAWLAARCRRQLDQALEHSQKAVELSPKNAGHIDTLAEVHFQRGEKDKALERMKQCIELDPKNDYFVKQLKRIEAGDRNADVPSEN